MSYPFGIIPPNGDTEGFEFAAFNCYALNLEELEVVIQAIVDHMEENPYDTNWSIDTYDLIGRELLDYEEAYVIKEANNRM